MPDEELFLDFYSIMRMHVLGPPDSIEFLRSEWRSFSVSRHDGTPEILVRVRPWRERSLIVTESEEPTDRVRLSGCYKGYQWRASVYEDAKTSTLEYAAVPRSNLLLKDSVLEPLVMQQLAEHGLFNFHASAASFGGKAWMICGPSKSGKTAMALLGHRKGHPVLSDDTVLLGENYLYPYPTPPRIYVRNLRRGKLLDGLLPGNVFAGLAINGFLALATLGQVRVPTRLTTRDLSDSSLKSPQRVPLGGLIFLLMTDHSTQLGVTEADDSIRQSLQSHRGEHASSFLTVLGRRTGSESARDAFVARLLNSFRASNRCIVVTLKRKMRLDEWEEVFSKTEKHVNALQEADV